MQKRRFQKGLHQRNRRKRGKIDNGQLTIIRATDVPGCEIRWIKNAPTSETVGNGLCAVPGTWQIQPVWINRTTSQVCHSDRSVSGVEESTTLVKKPAQGKACNLGRFLDSLSLPRNDMSGGGFVLSPRVIIATFPERPVWMNGITQCSGDDSSPCNVAIITYVDTRNSPSDMSFRP